MNTVGQRRGERGQVLILFALFLIVLLLFVGLVIDFGFAYVTRANLGKSLDAAALAAARYSALGQTQTTAIAQSVFAMNYGNSGRDFSPPVLSVTYPPDPNNNTLVSLTATATIRTFIIGLLPQFKTLNVSVNSQAKAARIGMTLILDRSGSMSGDGGSDYLPSSVNDFIDYFDNVKDSVSVVTFASNVTTDVPMKTGGFVTPVKNLTAKMNNAYFNGGTFSDGALQQAFTQELSPTVPGNVQKVVVFFTDGGANAIQSDLTCTKGSLKNGTWNFGGYDPPSTDVGFMVPATGKEQCDSYGGCCTGTFPSASQNKSVAPAWSSSGPATTPWSQGAIQVPITYPNVQADALYRAIGDANAMRQQGITVYSIGLGSAPSPADPTFLCQIANDPNCSPTYDSSKPAGVSIYVTNATNLDQAFQTIATIIRLRLVQ